MKRAEKAKARNTIPPMMVTVKDEETQTWGFAELFYFKSTLNGLIHSVQLISPVLTDIFWATILPPTTARPVQRQCPRVPPTATPNGSCSKQVGIEKHHPGRYRHSFTSPNHRCTTSTGRDLYLQECVCCRVRTAKQQGQSFNKEILTLSF